MKAILFDVTRCKGCEKCVQACVEANHLEEVLPAERARHDGLSSRRLMSVVEVGPGAFARKSCLHCLTPACVEACLVGAIRKTPEGPVTYDADKCIGCRYCMLACPVGIPRYEWDKKLPFVSKCSMCVERLEDGRSPACMEACPYEAMTFGERDDLLADAHQRIQAQPDTYLPHVYGETEMGGTCVLYISDVPLDSLGWPDEVGAKPLSAFTQPVMNATPAVALTVLGGVSALTWIIQRRNRMARERSTQRKMLDEIESEVEER